MQHLVPYHVVTEGACWGGLTDEPSVRLETCDIIVFPHGDAHTLSSAPDMQSSPKPALYSRYARSGLPVPVQTGGGGPERTRFVCGFLGCDIRPFNPLIATLPRLLHMRDTSDGGRGWLSQFVQLALAEAHDKRAGSDSILARLSELMFVEVVRRHLESLTTEL